MLSAAPHALRCEQEDRPPTKGAGLSPRCKTTCSRASEHFLVREDRKFAATNPTRPKHPITCRDLRGRQGFLNPAIWGFAGGRNERDGAGFPTPLPPLVV